MTEVIKRKTNMNEFAKLNTAELLEIISSEFHSSTKEALATVNLQLQTVHNCNPDDEELEFSLQLIKAIQARFDEHVDKEERLLFPLLSPTKKRNSANGKTEVAAFIDELIQEHKWMKNQFALIRKATHEYECKIDSFPSQKLGYAQMNNLEQDFNKIFFVEEEYLFPRILQLQH